MPTANPSPRSAPSAAPALGETLARLRSAGANVRFRVSAALRTLRDGHRVFYVFGLLHLAVAALLTLALPLTEVQVLGVHAYYKPIKFMLSTWALSWAMAYFLPLLRAPRLSGVYGWLAVAILGLENVYIVAQALRGTRSHFNTADAWGPLVFAAMGIAISAFTLATLYVGYRFVRLRRADLSPTLLTGVRWGIFLFVAFAFEGGLIGANGGHIVGGPEDAIGLPFLGWSLYHGDLRIAHFFGMHALQVMPLLGALLLRRRWMVHLAGTLYALLGLAVLAFALAGRGLLG